MNPVLVSRLDHTRIDGTVELHHGFISADGVDRVHQVLLVERDGKSVSLRFAVNLCFVVRFLAVAHNEEFVSVDLQLHQVVLCVDNASALQRVLQCGNLHHAFGLETFRKIPAGL